MRTWNGTEECSVTEDGWREYFKEDVVDYFKSPEFVEERWGQKQWPLDLVRWGHVDFDRSSAREVGQMEVQSGTNEKGVRDEDIEAATAATQKDLARNRSWKWGDGWRSWGRCGLFPVCLSIEFLWCVWRKVLEWGEATGSRTHSGMVG